MENMLRMALIDAKKHCENQRTCNGCVFTEDGYCAISDDPEYWRTDEWEKEMEREKTVTITRSGVAKICSWRETEIKVNDQNIVELLEEEIEKKKPVKDYDEGFAARVTIVVELLGDLEG